MGSRVPGQHRLPMGERPNGAGQNKELGMLNGTSPAISIQP